MIPTSNNTSNTHILFAAAIVQLAKMLFVLATLSMGFDLTDEGYHMLHYSRPSTYSVNVHNYQYLVNSLFGDGVSLLSLRIAWYATEVTSVLYLVYSLWVYLRPSLDGRSVGSGLIVVMSGAMFISVHDRILAYNELSNIFVYGALSSLLLGLASEGRARSLIFSTMGGMLAGGEVFIKLSSGVGTVVVLVLLLVALRNSRMIFWFLVGVFLGIATFFAFLLPPWDVWWPNYRQGLVLAAVAGYGGRLMLTMYLLQFVYFLLVIGLSTVPVFLVTNWLLTKNRAGAFGDCWVIVIGHMATVAIMLGLFLIGEQQEYCFELLGHASSIRYYGVMVVPQALVYVGLMGLSGEIRSPVRPEKKSIIVLLALTLIPAVIFFGAFSSIPMSLYGHLAPLLGSLFLYPILFWKQTYSRTFMSYLVALTVLCCGFFFTHNYVLHPARLLSPLSEQVVEIGLGESIKVDTSTASLVNRLRYIVDSNPTVGSILHIGHQPGIVYLTGKYQPSSAMYISAPYLPEIESMNLRYAKYYIAQSKDEIANSMLLINSGAHPEYFRSVTQGGVLLTSSHVLIDSIYNPYLKKEMVVNNYILSPHTYVYVPTQFAPPAPTR